MRNTIATYKESLSRIASDVLDATEEIELPGSRSRRESPMSERRFSHRFAQSVSPGGSPVPNGVGSGSVTEIDRQKAEIERLQASEAEIKALAINYAAILKEKEGQLSRLHDENDSLRKSLDARNGTSSLSKDENLKVTKNNSVAYKGSTNLSPNRQHRNTMQVSPRPFGNNAQKNTISKQEVFSNGSVQKTSSIPSTESEELETLLEEKNKGLTSLQAKYESEIKQLRMEVEKEHEISSNLKLKYEDEQKLSSSSQKELNDLKSENERISAEMKEMQKKLDMKLSEISRLQVELNRRNNEKESGKSFQDLESTIAILENDNSKLRIEKETLEAALELNNTEKADADNSESFDKALSNFKKEKEEMILSIQQLEKSLKDTCKERDKAQRELARLKQHLLDKELEESDKMDEDSKIIEELRAISDHQKDHIAKLEMALKQEITKQEELKNLKSHETHKMSDIINALNQKLANYTNIVESKNIELLNLQTALGQYYAESEAKERLEGELAVLREEMAKQSEVLKIAKQDLEISREEKEETLAKLSQAEKVLSESKRTVQKLQDDNLKLHRALEQSVTRMNRMSMDSDFYVDRRIVIKLLVTYFQRNHSKEVLDLMVRMLGFSEEDKQRIGFAQQAAGRTAVRGVLGLPGRLVGGILGGKTPEASSAVPSENQSFTDLWVDFLLKETEQRERREADGSASSSAEKGVYITGTLSVPGTSVPANAVSTTVQTSAGRYSSPSQKSNHLFEQDFEFATVPLTSSVSPPDETTSRLSRLLQKHRDPTV